MPKKKETKPQEKQFVVTVVGNEIQVANETLSDIEMIGALSVLLDAYQQRFKGGSENAEESIKPGGKA